MTDKPLPKRTKLHLAEELMSSHFFSLIDFIELPLFPPLIDALCKSLCESCSSTLVPLKELTLQRTGFKQPNYEDARKLHRTLACNARGGHLAKKKSTLKTVDQSLASLFLSCCLSNKPKISKFQSREAIRTIEKLD